MKMITKYLTVTCLLLFLSLGCSKSPNSPGSECADTLNSDKPSFLKVVNQTDSEHILNFRYGLRIGSVPKNDCWLFGLDSGSYRVAFEKVAKQDRTAYVEFSVKSGETHAITVTEGMF